MALIRGARAYYRAAWIFGVCIWLPFACGQWFLLSDGTYYDPDVFALYGLERWHDPSLFLNDYSADYLNSQWIPPGYAAILQVWAVFASLYWFHLYAPVALWLLCLPCVYACGRALGGKANAWGTLLIFACSSVFYFRMNAGMSHSFGFPLAWATLAALLTGRVRVLSAIVVLSALIYPVIAPVAGLTLALWLMFPVLAPCVPREAALLGAAWRKRAMWIVGIGLLTLILVLPQAFLLRSSYGSVLHAPHDLSLFPELGNGVALINPFIYVVSVLTLSNSVRLGLEAGQWLTLGMLMLPLFYVIFRDVRDRRVSGIKPFAYAAFAIFLLAYLFAYDHAYRVGIYMAPVLLCVFLPLTFRRLARYIFPRRFASQGFAALIIAFATLTAKAQPEALGYYFKLEPFQQRAIDFIQTLPKDVLIAGWPGDRHGRVVEAVPFLAHRRVLVTWAVHAITHRDYVLTMRDRMNAMVDAYLARDMAPILRLRDEFGVTHLVVNVADLNHATPPVYFSPFTERAKERWEGGQGAFLVASELPDSACVYDQDNVKIYALDKIN